MTTQGPMTRQLLAALREAKPAPRDAGAVQLAKRYAALIDDASVLAKYLEPLRQVRRAVEESSDPEGAGKQLDKIVDALAAHSVASDLGPKLLAALTALGMTAAGRGAVKGDGPGDSGTPATPAGSALGKLRSVPPAGRVG